MRNLALLLVVACGGSAGADVREQSAGTASAAVTSDRPKFAVEWMNLFAQQARVDKLSPPEAARVFGYAGVTLHEVTRYSAPEPLASLQTQLNGLSDLPAPRTDVEHDWNVALASAMGELMEQVFYSNSARQAAADLRDRQIAERKGAGVTQLCADDSIAFGTELGQAIARWAADDGVNELAGHTWVSVAGEGHWEATGAALDPTQPFWGTLRPFALATADDCRAVKPSRFSTDTSSAFYQEAQQTLKARKEATADDKAAISFWADEAGHWIGSTGERLLRDDSRLSRAGKTYALIGVALADAYLSAWQDKFRHDLMRPVTYINRYLSSSWAPLAVTQPWPEYVSSQAAAAAASAEILTTLYGDGPVDDGARSYPSYWDAALESAESGVNAGLQFPMSADAGVSAGSCVAKALLARVRI